MFATLQNRLPQELRLAAITTMAEANAFLREIYLPATHTRFAVPAEAEGSAFVPFTGSLDDILCIQGGPDRRQRQHGALQAAGAADPGRIATAAITSRHRCGSTNTPAAPWRSSTARAGWPDIRPTAPSSTKPRTAERPREPLRRAPGLWISGQPATAGSPLIHRPNNHNRSGQFIWYIKRSIRNVLDSKRPSRVRSSSQ